jgi:hypothetical protein
MLSPLGVHEGAERHDGEPHLPRILDHPRDQGEARPGAAERVRFLGMIRMGVRTGTVGSASAAPRRIT